MPEQYTLEECRQRFLEHVWHMIDFWDKEGRGDTHHKLEGLAFSILAAIDGSACAVPGFVLAPAPHPLDKLYNIKHGQKYYPKAPTVECDIAGELHELFHDVGRAMGLHT